MIPNPIKSIRIVRKMMLRRDRPGGMRATI
jgi:hypothetical protein